MECLRSTSARLGLVIALIVVIPSPRAEAAIGLPRPSLEWIALTSDRITLVAVDSVAFVVQPQGGFHRMVQFRVIRDLLGDGPVEGEVKGWPCSEDPPPSQGDTLLVLWQVERNKIAYTPHCVQWFSISRRDQFSGDPALSTDFRVVHDPDSILALVERRVSMIDQGRPLGDDRPWSLQDFVAGRGRLVFWMPPESEAAAATFSMSLNMLEVPADSVLLPSILEMTHSGDAKERAVAASWLGEYPVAPTMARLTEMLADTGAVIVQYAAGDVAVHAPRVLAYQALSALGSSPPRPENYDAEHGHIGFGHYLFVMGGVRRR